MSRSREMVMPEGTTCRLRCGGRVMVVGGLSDVDGESYRQCYWHDDSGSYAEGTYPVEVLEPAAEVDDWESME